MPLDTIDVLPHVLHGHDLKVTTSVDIEVSSELSLELDWQNPQLS